MAAYHACWDLNYYSLITAGIGEDPVWISAQRGILTAFLLLAGAGLTLGHADGINWRSFWRREAVLVGAATSQVQAALTIASLTRQRATFVDDMLPALLGYAADISRAAGIA